MNYMFVVVQLLSHVWLFSTSWTAVHEAFLSFTLSQSLPKLMSTESMMLSNHPFLCHPLLLLPSIFPTIKVFSSESALHIRWPNYWSFSFSISPPNEDSRLIFFRIDWLDLLAIQETLKSILQNHNLNASILRCLAFFMDQFSHPNMTTRKTIALTKWTFVSKVESLLFNMLSKSIIAFPPRSKHLLILWPVSPFAMILEPKKPVFHCFHCFPTYSERSDGTRCHDLGFLNVEF